MIGGAEHLSRFLRGCLLPNDITLVSMFKHVDPESHPILGMISGEHVPQPKLPWVRGKAQTARQ